MDAKPLSSKMLKKPYYSCWIKPPLWGVIKGKIWTNKLWYIKHLKNYKKSIESIFCYCEFKHLPCGRKQEPFL